MILHLSTENDALGEMDLSGSMTRQVEQDMPVQDDSSHIVNVGKLVEDMELKMRNLLRMFILYRQSDRFARLTGDRGGIFWESERRCGRPPKYDISEKRIGRGSLIFFLGIPPLTDANKEKATHQEMINSMYR